MFGPSDERSVFFSVMWNVRQCERWNGSDSQISYQSCGGCTARLSHWVIWERGEL